MAGGVKGGAHKPHGYARRRYGCACEKCLPSGQAGDASRFRTLDELKHYPGGLARRRFGCDCRKCLPSGQAGSGSGPRILDRPLTPSERRRRSRQNLRDKPVPPGVKHGIYAARVYNCKCSTCRAVRNLHNDRKRRPWRYGIGVQGRWRELGGQKGKTVVCWPPRDAGPNWVCPECGRGPLQGREAA